MIIIITPLAPNIIIPMKTTAPIRSFRGFTLVEIMIVVVIIGLLATMAMSTFNKIREAAQNSATINDLRIFAGIFNTYQLEEGIWPAETGPGVVPPGLDVYFPGGNSGVFTTRTPIGGNYDWDFQVHSGVKAAVSVTNPIASNEQLSRLESRADGQPGGGTYFLNGTTVVHVIEFE